MKQALVKKYLPVKVCTEINPYHGLIGSPSPAITPISFTGVEGTPYDPKLGYQIQSAPTEEEALRGVMELARVLGSGLELFVPKGHSLSIIPVYELAPPVEEKDLSIPQATSQESGEVSPPDEEKPTSITHAYAPPPEEPHHG